MAYSVDEKLSETVFMDTLTEKAKMLKKHLKDTKINLVICMNIGPNMTTFKFYNPQEENSLKLHYTISNLGVLKDQFYQLWVQINYLLKENYPYKS